MKSSCLQPLVVAVAAATNCIGLPAAADTPSHDAFTYQGQLKHNGDPVAGPKNLAFRLYDAVTGGDQVGPELQAFGFDTFDDDGRFTLDLAFGKVIFDGTPLWLEIDVDGTTLLPRQPIMPTPYSVRALNVATVTDPALAGTYTNALTLNNPANQFIGAFAGSGAGLTSLNASNIASGTLNTAHFPTGGTWTLASNLNVGGAMLVIPATGRVGIGTLSPTSRLHVVTSSGTSAIQGVHTASTGTTLAGYFQNASTNGIGAHGLATSPNGPAYGLHGRSLSTTGRGVFGQASAVTGTAAGVFGQVNSPNGFAGYFIGPEGSRNYFERSVGIGTASPDAPLHVATDAANNGFYNPAIFGRTTSDVDFHTVGVQG